MRRDVLVIIFLTLATFADSLASELTVADSRLESLPRTVAVSVYFLDKAGKPLLFNSIPRELTIHLGAMPGRFGGVGDIPLQTIRVGPKMLFQLDLVSLTAKLRAGATRSKEDDGAPLKLTPDFVKFSRVSTGAFSGADPLRGFAVVFWDLEANGSLGPVFFDRPCQLHAPLLANDAPIDIPSSGLAWMLTKKDENERYTLALAVNPRLAIIIAPPEAIEGISTKILRGSTGN